MSLKNGTTQLKLLDIFTKLMAKNSWMKELSEDILPNSEVEMSALNMTTEREVQFRLIMRILWHHLKRNLQYQSKNWQWSFLQIIQLFPIFNNFESFLNLENGCLTNCLKSTANTELTYALALILVNSSRTFLDRLLTGDKKIGFLWKC